MRGLGSLVASGGSAVKSIQTGTIALGASATATATITAVDPTNAVVLFDGVSSNSLQTEYDMQYVAVSLTNSTTVTATRGGANNDSTILAYCVIEYQPGVIKSVQTGTVTLLNTTSNTATITSVDTTKAAVHFGGQFTTNTSAGIGGQNSDYRYYKVVLTNGTTVTVTRFAAGGVTVTMTVRYTIVEFI